MEKKIHTAVINGIDGSFLMVLGLKTVYTLRCIDEDPGARNNEDAKFGIMCQP